MKKKLFISAILSFDALSANIGSSIFSSAIRPVSRKLHVADEVGTVGIGLFVFGYAFGPLVSSFHTPNLNEMLMIYFTFTDLGAIF